MLMRKLALTCGLYRTLASAQDVTSGAPCACTQLSSLYPDSVLFPDSANYTSETKKYWDVRSDLSPACIVFPACADEVAQSVSVLASCDAQFAIRGGGHMNFPGSNNIDGGVLLALNHLTDISVSETDSTVTVSPGNRWVDVYSALDPFGLYTIGGRMKSIGVPGLTLIGGFNYLINKYGFTMDNVVSYDVVLGNGTQVVASVASNPDLFWALKGGANNFGIVTKFVFKTYKIPLISTTIQQFDEASIEKFIQATSEHTLSDDGSVAAGSIITIGLNATTKVISGSLLGVQEGTESPPSRFAAFSAIPPVFTFNNVTSPILWHSQLVTPDQMFRVIFAHHTVRADAAGRLFEIYKAWIAALEDVLDVEGLNPTLVFNTVARTAAAVGKENGIGNVWDLAADQPLIIWQLSTAWANAVDDERVKTWAKNFIDYHHSVNQDLGVASKFIYMGDAGEFQNPFLGFPAENVLRLNDIRTRYDPDLVFAKLNQGGFKMGL